MIVCYERLKKEEDKEKGQEDWASVSDFYMKQTGKLDNACGAIACLHAIYNNLGEGKITLGDGSHLKSFLDDGKEKTPEERAKLLEDSTGF